MLSTVRFDETGDYLATGDKGGRVVVFVRSDAGRGRHCSRKRPHSAVASEGEDRGGSTGVGGGSGGGGGLPAGELAPARAHARPTGLLGPSSAEYQFYAEFQSHTAEFDCLKSAEIEEKINKVRDWRKPLPCALAAVQLRWPLRGYSHPHLYTPPSLSPPAPLPRPQIAWCKQATDSLLLLTTNDRSIKLWKVHERTARTPAYRNVELGRYGGRLPIRELRIPPLNAGEAAVHISSRRLFSATAHTYDINSLSTCSDGATFLSSDDLRVNLWSLDNPKLCFNIVDLKPAAAEDLMELINSAKFHPTSCALFAYSTSKGSLRVGDTRAAALCDGGAKSYGNPSAGGEAPRSYISQITCSLTGLEFSGDGRYVVGRDYMRCGTVGGPPLRRSHRRRALFTLTHAPNPPPHVLLLPPLQRQGVGPGHGARASGSVPRAGEPARLPASALRERQHL